jgi:cell division septal protein FtsQ
MNRESIPSQNTERQSDNKKNRGTIDRRLERRIQIVLWALAAACFLFATMVWWRLLTAGP